MTMSGVVFGREHVTYMYVNRGTMCHSHCCPLYNNPYCRPILHCVSKTHQLWNGI